MQFVFNPLQVTIAGRVSYIRKFYEMIKYMNFRHELYETVPRQWNDQHNTPKRERS